MPRGKVGRVDGGTDSADPNAQAETFRFFPESSDHRCDDRIRAISAYKSVRSCVIVNVKINAFALEKLRNGAYAREVG